MRTQGQGNRKEWLLSFAVWACVTPTPALAILYNITDLGTLGGPQSQAYGINDLGQVVGWAHTSTAWPFYGHAFRWENGAMTDLGHLGGNYSEARGINNAGQVVGNSSTVSGNTHGFLYSAGTMRGLTLSGGTSSRATAINNSGAVAGHSNGNYFTGQRVFRWQNESMTDLGAYAGNWAQAYAIDGGGAAYGETYVPTWKWGQSGFYDNHAFRFSNPGNMNDLHQTLVPHPQGPNDPWTPRSAARAANEASEAAGDWDRPDIWGGGHHAVSWTARSQNSWVDLGPGYAYGMNDALFFETLMVVGASGGHAMLWEIDPWGGTWASDLNLLIPLDSEWELVEARDVNRNGQIVGWGIAPDGQTRGFLLNPIPEPGTLAMLAVGTVLGLTRMRRRRAGRFGAQMLHETPRENERDRS